MESCTKCTHFKMCVFVVRLKGSLKRHRKIFKPVSGSTLGPVEKIYRVVAEGCLHFLEEKDNG